MTEETDRDLGDLLRDLRTQRKLSVKRLAKLASVSRKTVDNVEAGLNVSVLVLRKLLSALGVDEITIRVSGAHSVRASASLPSQLISGVATELRRKIEAMARVVDELEALPARSDLDAQADQLIRSFTEYVRSVDDPDQLATLEQSVTPLYRRRRQADPAAKRRRKSA